MYRTTCWIITQLILLSFLLSPVLASDYDYLFKKYSKRYFSITFDWTWFKAQALAESNLNPNAASPVGAIGLMQVMPATFRDIRKKTGFPDYVHNPMWNIASGIYYDRYLYDEWASPRPKKDRLALMFASYNAGIGNILKAQKICEKEKNPSSKENCNLWGNIKKRATKVHSWKHKETLAYVIKIFKYKEELKWRK